LELSPREFDLLFTLARSAGQVLSTDEILNRVWGAEFIGQPQVVYVHIRWLREKLEDNPNRPQRILTVRGVGYKYQPEELL
jgi:DNA-binding response OmpR family regulator